MILWNKKVKTSHDQMKIKEDKDHFLNNTFTSPELEKVERDRKLVIIAKSFIPAFMPWLLIFKSAGNLMNTFLLQ